ncbi:MULTISPECIES: hypothetical protein [unclassified Kribbella]|uniref:hypothetical protein n=1 Tax=unclassified Kribbella TaxID=2644121 RepID=UPI003019C967
MRDRVAADRVPHRVWVTLDALQHALGSPTSGAPILPPYDLQPRAHRVRFTLS